MKTLALFAALTALAPAHAQVRGSGSIDTQIETAVSTLSRSVLDRRAHQSLSDQTKRDLLATLRDATNLLRRGGNGGNTDPNYPPYPGYGMQVFAYSDDRCQNLITEVKPQDNCSTLNSVFSARQVWSVPLDDVCINVSDRSFTSACESMRAAATQPKIKGNAVTLYTDDRCQNTLINLDPTVNYETLHTFLAGQQVWSVRVENKCINTPDRGFDGKTENNLVRTALSMRGYGASGEVFELFSDDRCQNSVTTVQRGNDCAGLSQFYGSQQVWSIKFRGACGNISDTTFPIACQTYAH